ncbi:MAG: peptide deformylase [Spirochaetaceae bacterium]|nr:peptide deformylase [Spirochaetaceae bacterium]
MNIHLFEDNEQLTTLRSVNLPVAKSEDLTATLAAMFKVMKELKGIGLAAPQIGLNKRFFIAEIEEGKPLIFINPEIISTSIEMATHEEGCLSLPALYEKISRPAYIKIQAQNERGRNFSLEADGLLAVCLQHEYDHINGKLFIDYLDEKKLAATLKKYAKLVQKRKI